MASIAASGNLSSVNPLYSMLLPKNGFIYLICAFCAFPLKQEGYRKYLLQGKASRIKPNAKEGYL
jgi:hypothetical protein